MPLAITNAICKIFKRMNLKKEKKIDDRQFGFRNQKSKIYATLKINTKKTTIFFDIEKVYDKINKNKTLNNWRTWVYRDE